MWKNVRVNEWTAERAIIASNELDVSRCERTLKIYTGLYLHN